MQSRASSAPVTAKGTTAPERSEAKVSLEGKLPRPVQNDRSQVAARHGIHGKNRGPRSAAYAVR
jgi:hypothetical protein